MTLDRAAIERRLPHAGDMCLLDAVQQWDATDITCVAAAPSAAHPLARGGVVPAVAAAEYAAQATAMHGALLGGGRTPAGMLAKLSNVEFHAKLHSGGRRPSGRARSSARPKRRQAAFTISKSTVRITRLLSGRLMVAFTAPPA